MAGHGEARRRAGACRLKEARATLDVERGNGRAENWCGIGIRKVRIRAG